MGDLAVWLHGVIEGDLRCARKRVAEAARLRLCGLSYRVTDHERGIPDPQDTIARCEAELAILDEHAPVPDHGRYSGSWLCDEDCSHRDGERVCRSCRDYAGDPVPAPCRTVALLGSGYRHRPGYRPEWAPEAP